MVRDPLDPYVAAVAVALEAAGLVVAGTWTEPVIPVDHVVSVDGGDPTNPWTVHLVWEDGGRGWRYFAYAPAYARGSYPPAADLPGCGGRADALTVVSAAQDLLSTLAAT